MKVLHVGLERSQNILKRVEMCNEAVAQSWYALRFVPVYFKTQEMCKEAISSNPAALFLIPDDLKTQEMWYEELEVDPWSLYDIPDYLKIQEMCNEAVRDDPSSLQFVPHWFVSQQQLDAWYDDDYWHHDDELIEWYEGYKKRKAEKAKIKEEHLPIAWHPSRYWDWCMSEDDKRRWK